MAEIETRVATMEDYSEICRLYRQLDEYHADILPNVFQRFPDPPRPREVVARSIEQDRADYILAIADGRIVGCLNLNVSSHPPYPMFRGREFALVENMIVDAEYRGKGIGASLLEEAKAWAQERGLRFIQTTVWSANERARAFYVNQGFVPVTEKLELRL
jgi:ribosomal protein S18 acetylase RimI-like enzyme